jgi:ribosomal protein L37AE/L43A
MDSNLDKVICPYCVIEVEPFPFGFGFVWICPKCGKVVKTELVSIEGKNDQKT